MKTRLTPQDFYREHGYLVMASAERITVNDPPIPLDKNDWNEDDMCDYRWAAIAEASQQELVDANKAMGFTNAIHQKFRFFYRVIALD